MISSTLLVKETVLWYIYIYIYIYVLGAFVKLWQDLYIYVLGTQRVK